MRRKIFKTCFGLIFCNTLLYSTENQTLNKAINSAIKNHPKIQIEEYSIKSVEKDLEQAYGNYYPKVDVEIDYGKRDTINNGSSTNYKGYTSEMSLSQKLFNGFKDSAMVEQNKESLKNKTIAKEIAVDNLTLDVVNSYSNIIKYRNLIKIQTETLKKFNKYNDISLKNSKLTGKETDYLTVTSKLERLTSNLIESKWLLRKYQVQFKQLTGNTLAEDAKIDQLSFVKILKIDDAMKILDTQKNTLLEARSNVVIQKHEINIAKSELYPKVDLALSSSKGSDLDQFETNYEENKVLLKLKYNIFNGMIDKHNIEKKTINHLRAKSSYDNIVKEQEEKIAVLYNLYSSTNERIERLINYVYGQNRLVDLYQTEFDTGKRTIVNLVDAIKDLNDAKVMYINSYFELINSTYTLAFELGILTDEIKSNNFSIVNNIINRNTDNL